MIALNPRTRPNPGRPRKRLTLEAVRDRATVSVPEAAEVLGLSLNRCYNLVHQGRLPVLPGGGRIRISVPALLRWLDMGGNIGSDATT